MSAHLSAPAHRSAPGRLWLVSALAMAAVFAAGLGPGRAARAAPPVDSQRASEGASGPIRAGASDWRTVVNEFAQEHFKNPAWGYSHSVRDYRLARELAAADHVTLDDDVLYAASYLHDMAALRRQTDNLALL